MSVPQDSPVPQDSAAQRLPYWPVPIVRAVLALALGVFVTFSQDHSVRLGLFAFGAFAVLTGAAVVLFGLLRMIDRRVGTVFVIQGLVAIAAGVLALVLNQSGVAFLLYLLSVFAALTGFLELYNGLRMRGRLPEAREWVAAGALTAIAALVFVLGPLDSVFAVGVLGAYAVILGVYLAIGGLSLRWSQASRSAAAAAGSPSSGSGS